MASRAVFEETYWIENTIHFEKGRIPGTNHRLIKKGKLVLPTPGEKKNFERTPRATHCTDRAQTSTTVSERPSPVDLLIVCANGERGRTKRLKRTNANN